MNAPLAPWRWALLGALLLAGVWLRLPDATHRARRGVDEGHYERYVTELVRTGLGGFPQLHAGYLARQRAEPYAFLPPTRVLFLSTALGWQRLTQWSPMEALRSVSCAAAVATLLLGTLWAFRLGGWSAACGLAALLGSAPLLIHLAHRALIDGFFAFWALLALWSLWETLRAPERRFWLWLYGGSLAALVLTKENAAFAYAGLGGILALNRWLKIGHPTRALYAVTLAAPALAVLLLILCAGGISTLLEVYRLNIQKSVILPYAIATGDGPWHRYLLDFLLVSPAITLLALASLGATPWNDPVKRALVAFVAISYLLMAQVRYGMNLRYGALWEFPLCWLAYRTVTTLLERHAARHHRALTFAVIGLICATELRQYQLIFVQGSVYDPTPGALSQALRMFKPAPKIPAATPATIPAAP